MNLLKKMTAALLAVLMLASFAACHPKDEVALTIGDVDITSAMYMCFLIQADGEARDAVDNANADNTDYDSNTVDYYAQKVDDTDFSAWVKNRAQEVAAEYAAYMAMFKDRELTLSDEDQSMIDTYVNYYWNTYGYSQMYEPNGVSLSTYKEYFSYSYKSKACFMSVYGADGTDPVADEEVRSTISANFAPVNVLTLSYSYTDSDNNTVDYSEEEIAAIKEKAQTYAQRLRNGEKFSTLYLEENPSADTSSVDTSDESIYATVFVSEAAQSYVSSNYYTHDHWDEASALAVGEVKVIDDDDKSLVLYKYQNVLDNENYISTFTEPALYVLKQSEFEEKIKADAAALEVQTNSYAVDRFKPSKIEYPKSSTSGSAGTTASR